MDHGDPDIVKYGDASAANSAGDILLTDQHKRMIVYASSFIEIVKHEFRNIPLRGIYKVPRREEEAICPRSSHLSTLLGYHYAKVKNPGW